jgi:quercetin dioxygenase-like cupin family protein
MGCAGLVAGLTLSAGSAQAFPFHPIATAPLPDGEVVEQLTFNLRPGLETGWHYHQGDVWVVVLSGTLTEDRGCNQPPEVHEAGTAFAEAPGVVHNVTNTGVDVAKIAVQGVGPSCTANYNDAVSVSGPPACDENDNPEIVPGPYCP